MNLTSPIVHFFTPTNKSAAQLRMLIPDNMTLKSKCVSLTEGEWDANVDFFLSALLNQVCESNEKEDMSGNIYSECSCTSLEITTMVDVLESVLVDSNIEEIFSAQGFE